VGVYFITQNPADVPEAILGQLGNRVQHALRAFTAKDQKDLRMAADTYRPNPDFKTEDAIREVGTGEAVTSFLEAKGVPGIVQRTLIRPPSSQVGPIEAGLRAQVIAASPVKGKYEALIDRNSAYEMLRDRAAAAAKAAEAQETAPQPGGDLRIDAGELREFNKGRRYDGGRTAEPPKPKAQPRASRADSVTEAFAKSFARQLGSRTGQAVVRGVLGTIFGKR
jgi:hypothetical protein